MKATDVTITRSKQFPVISWDLSYALALADHGTYSAGQGFRMKITEIDRSSFFELCYGQPDIFLRRIKACEAFVVKAAFEQQVRKLRDAMFEWGQRTESSWHPLVTGCPDYHRLHDNYPNAYVKQKFHAFYKHGYIADNQPLFETFSEVFKAKAFLSDFLLTPQQRSEEPPLSIANMPSDFVVARVNIHHYPLGGGYQAMHVDPDNHWASIQTLIAASDYGKDYSGGGVYAVEGEADEKLLLDPFLASGDMLVMTPAVKHGVAPIDPECEYSPHTNNGRWMVLPIFVHSDYPREQNIKPKQIG